MKPELRTILASISILLSVNAFAGGPDTPHWSVTWKRLNMTGPAMELIGVLNPLPTRESPASLWSIGCETLDRDYADFDKYRPWLCEAGARSARIQSGWAKCETVKGKYDFAWLDHIIDGLIEEGMRPWVTLGYGNPAYGAEKSLGSKIFSDDITMKAWRRYVSALVNRYRDMVTGRIYSVKRYRGDVMAGRQKFTGLNLWDSPMLLIDRKYLPDGTITSGSLQTGSVRDMKF